MPVGSIDDVFTAEIGPKVGEINWESLCWPDAPEVGSLGESKQAEVTLLLNTRKRELDDDHTGVVRVRSVGVGVDGRQIREPCAHWLAEQVGLTVIGPGQRCSSRPSRPDECRRRAVPRRAAASASRPRPVRTAGNHPLTGRD